MKHSIRELFYQDLSKLRAIASRQAIVYAYIEDNRDIRLTSDERKRRSKQYRAATRFHPKGLPRKYSDAARKIYSAWKYLGIDCVEAGKIYQSILNKKLNDIKVSGKSYRLTGEEHDWLGLMLHTEKSKYLANVKKDKFLATLNAVSIEPTENKVA